MSKFFVGGASTVWMYDTDTSVWTNMGYAGGLLVRSLDGVSPTDLWAGTNVGSGVPTFFHFDGTSWTKHEMSTETVGAWCIFAVHARSSDGVYFYAHRDSRIVKIWKWDGAAFAVITSWTNDPGLYQGCVWSTADDDVYLGAYADHESRHWNGTSLQTANLFSSGNACGSINGYSADEVILCGYYDSAGSERVRFGSGKWGSWTAFPVSLLYWRRGGGATTLQLTEDTIYALLYGPGGDTSRHISKWDRATRLTQAFEAVPGCSVTTYGFSVIDADNMLVVGEVNGSKIKLDGVWSAINPAGGALYSVWGYGAPVPTPTTQGYPCTSLDSDFTINRYDCVTKQSPTSTSKPPWTLTNAKNLSNTRNGKKNKTSLA